MMNPGEIGRLVKFYLVGNPYYPPKRFLIRQNGFGVPEKLIDIWLYSFLIGYEPLTSPKEKMTRVEQTATASLVTSLGAVQKQKQVQKHMFQLFNSIEKGRFRVALAYLKRAQHVLRAEHVLPQIT
jgi:hypothetical protein